MTETLIRFRAATASHISTADAEVIGPELLRLVEAAEGQLDLDALWQEAKKKNSPLHPYWNWNVEEAAKQAWRERAAYLARNVLVCWHRAKEGQTVEEYVRVIHMLEVDEEPEPGEAEAQVRPGHKIRRAFSTKAVMQSEDLSDQVIEQALHYLRKFRERYTFYATNLPKFAKKFRAVFRAIERLK